MATALPRAVVDLEDFAESINLMVYGDTGVGKSELIGYLPGKVLILSSENGTMVIKRMMSRLGISPKEAKRFKVWPIRSWKDLEDAYIWVRDNPGQFDWIAIDSATSVQQRSMRAAMEVAVRRNPEKRDIDLPDRGEHQKMQNSMKRMVGDFNELPVNTFWLAQAMRREDRDGNEIVLPFIMGKDYEVSAWVCAQMQAFAYYAKRPAKIEVTVRGKKVTRNVTERALIWDSYADSEDVTYWAKDRYQIMPPVTVMATGEKQTTSFRKLIESIMTADPEAVAAAAADRDKDAQGARSFQGTVEPDEDDQDDDEPGDEADADGESEGDEDTTEAPPAPAKKAAAKKVAAKKAGRKFKPATEDEE